MNGTLLEYEVFDLGRSILQRRISLGKQKLSEIRIIKHLNILVIKQEKKILIFDLETFTVKETLSGVSTAFDIYNYTEVSSKRAELVTCIAVAEKRKLTVFKWTDLEISGVQTFNLDFNIKKILFIKDLSSFLAVDQSKVDLLRPSNQDLKLVKKLIGFPGYKSVNILEINEKNVFWATSYNLIKIFQVIETRFSGGGFGEEGLGETGYVISQINEIEEVKILFYFRPFVLVITANSILIRSPESGGLIMKHDLQGITSICSDGTRLVVSTRNTVFKLEISIEETISELIESENFLEAEETFKFSNRNFVNRSLFDEIKLKEAECLVRDQRYQMAIDAFQCIDSFSEELLLRLVGKERLEDQFEEEFAECLIDFIVDKRSVLIKEPHLNLNLLKFLDSVLLKAYCDCRQMMVGPFLRVENFCEMEKVERLLTRNKLFNELLDFYLRRGADQRAVKLLRTMHSEEDLSTTIQFLKKLNTSHLEVILEHAKWIYEKDQDLAFSVFVREDDLLPASRVLEFIEENMPLFTMKYLVYIVRNRNETDLNLINKLIMNLIKKNGGYTLRMFLLENSNYDEEFILENLPLGEFKLERAFLLCKAQRYSEAVVVALECHHDLKQVLRLLKDSMKRSFILSLLENLKHSSKLNEILNSVFDEIFQHVSAHEIVNALSGDCYEILYKLLIYSDNLIKKTSQEEESLNLNSKIHLLKATKKKKILIQSDTKCIKCGGPIECYGFIGNYNGSPGNLHYKCR